MTNKTLAAMTPSDFGALFRAERKNLKKSQSWVAEHAQVRRETIVQLEQGQNVGLHIIMKALGALNKGLMIASDRPDYDQIKGMFHEE